MDRLPAGLAASHPPSPSPAEGGGSPGLRVDAARSFLDHLICFLSASSESQYHCGPGERWG
eukprot:4391018-Karenia_brevis.AAC.1